MARKLGASLVFMTTVPYSLPELSWAVGDPWNPSFTPNVMLGLTQNMNFQERLLNTIFTTFYLLGRKFYVHPKIESMLAEVFPQDTIPALDDLKQSSGLLLKVLTLLTDQLFPPSSLHQPRLSLPG